MRRLALALLASAGLGACGHYEENPFPLETGFQPLEACTAPEPARAPGTCPETPYLALTGPTGNRDGHDWGHAKAFVNAPLDKVWAAMQQPDVCHVHDTNSWAVVATGTEPFPLSFVIEYKAGPLDVAKWRNTYRGGPFTEPPELVGSYGMRAQKTSGNSNISVQSISVVARTVESVQTGGTIDCVELEMVGWVHITMSGQAEAIGLTTDFYYALTAWLRGEPIPP